MSSITRFGPRALLMLALVPALRAQDDPVLLPPRPASELPLASPRASGFVGRIVSVTRGESAFGAEREAEVGIGEDFRLLDLARGAHPVSLEFGVHVYGRFSLDDPKSSLISNDWLVGLNTVAEFGPVLVALRVYHESSHLGDEYSEETGATRLDWSREVAGVWGAYRAGHWTVHGNLNVTLIDELGLERLASAAAVDWRGGTGRLLGLPMRPVAGLYVDGAAATAWKATTSMRVGLVVESGLRSIALSLIALDGLSTQRQFFRERSRYIGAEFRFDL